MIEVHGDALPVSQLRLEHLLKLIELRLIRSAVFIFFGVPVSACTAVQLVRILEMRSGCRRLVKKE